MAKLVVHAYTKDEINNGLKTPEELLTTVSNSLGGFVAWVDLVDDTNKSTYRRDDE